MNFPREDGPWRLIGLNDNFEQKSKYKKEMADQKGWLEKKLDMTIPENRPNCVLAFWHAPTFTSGRHGHDYKTESDAPLTKGRPMQTVWRILYRHGASVVLNGHDHNYEQFSPQNPDGNSAEEDGIRAFVVGTGGSLLTEDVYSNMAPNSEGLYGLTKLKNGSQGVLKIELFEDKYAWDFLAIDGKKLDLPVTERRCNKRKTPA